MLRIIKRTTIGVIYLMILPVFMLLTGWTWHFQGNSYWLISLYWFTQSVTSLYGIIIDILLIFWLIWCLRYQIKSVLYLIFILIIMLFIGQGIKSIIKFYTAVPRPFIVWINKIDSSNHNSNYIKLWSHHSYTTIENKLNNEKTIPKWLKCYWQKEKNSSFPSGHTIFVASWVLLLTELLKTRKYIFSMLLLIIWANMVIISRLVLGMHWLGDIIVGILISWMIVIPTSWVIRFHLKYLPNNK